MKKPQVESLESTDTSVRYRRAQSALPRQSEGSESASRRRV